MSNNWNKLEINVNNKSKCASNSQYVHKQLN